MRALIMPNQQNRILLDILRREFISERFDFFMRETAHRCGVVYMEEDIASSKLMLMMDKVIVHQVVRMYTHGEMHDFMSCLQRKHFGDVIDMPHPYLSEFFEDIATPFVGGAYDPLDSMANENTLRRGISTYIGRIYKENTDNFNQALINLMYACHEQLPKAIRLHRVELTPVMAPIVLCDAGF